MKVYLETLGCQMNRLDSELVSESLRQAGHELTTDAKSADAVLYNTCSVRQHAEEKVYARLGSASQRKTAGRVKLIIGVLGCMAQREGEDLRRKYPAIDIICSPGQISTLPEMLASAAAGISVIALDPSRKQARDASAEARMDELDLARNAEATPSDTQAFVRIMRGCNNFCSYCIVPYTRGPERSRSPKSIEEEARKLVDAGRTEITLLGQTVNRYRWQQGGQTVRFSDLLHRVAQIDGLRRLRFVTSHPIDFTNDVLEAMRDLPNVCEYIHCPAQSGSDAMLKAMNRGYTRQEYDDLVDRAREIVPNVVLASDFIVGFCGETEEDHQASAELIRRSGFKNSFIFKYSPRPDTHAAQQMTDDVSDEVKKRRNNELLAVQAEVGLLHHQGYINQTVEVLVEGPSRRANRQPIPAPPGETQLVGRTRGDHIVVFDGPETLAGSYQEVIVTDATDLTLFARRV
jgi:tRNA-2-methylthio-N6-dimethylallyladenosine synthase